MSSSYTDDISSSLSRETKLLAPPVTSSTWRTTPPIVKWGLPFSGHFHFSSWQGSPSTSSSVHVKWGLGSLKWMRNESVSTYHLPLEAGSDVLYYWIPMPSALQLIGFHASHVLEKMATPLGQFRTTAQFLCFENRGLVWLECALVDTFFWIPFCCINTTRTIYL